MDSYPEHYPKPPVVKWKARAKAFALFSQGKRPRDISPRAVNGIRRKKLHEYYGQWRKLEELKGSRTEVAPPSIQTRYVIEDKVLATTVPVDKAVPLSLSPAEEATALPSSGEMQLVVFELAGQAYGLDISTVQEIIQVPGITRVPGTPPFVKGVISLRGRVVVIVDLHTWFELPVPENTTTSRVLIADAGDEDVGVVVDVATEVLRVPADSIEPPSPVVTGVNSAYLAGVAKVGERLILLLDFKRLFAEMHRG